ncbi:HAD family hydrolase [Candidatus Bathyarchaeota archaeon]|nr:HAD family hydrolase [Candidatus Bathyarchaeota archaeon]
MNQWMEIVNPDVKMKVGNIRYALIDFDGTISVIRQGWEDVMIPLMIEMICDGKPPTPEIEKEVRDYVDYSTGMLTIKQMTWLAEAVRRHGIAKKPKSPYEYKRIYNERLLIRVNKRLDKLNRGELNPDDLMIMGSRRFLEELYKRGVVMYLASGTDHEYVLKEASALKITQYFRGGIYGALDHTEAHTKERIIQRILEENNLRGNELLVVGDGPVEIKNAKSRNAIALGVASDEIKRCGLNPRKRRRLINAGADIIIPDFIRCREIISLLFRE